MRKKVLILLVIFAAAAGLMVATFNVSDAARRPTKVDIKRDVDLSDQAITQMILAGWSLGGVYPDCGEGSGDVVLTANINTSLLPFYWKLQSRNKDEMLALLRKQFPNNAENKLKKITAGKDKITTYGGTERYQSLQDDFDQLQRILSEIKEAPKVAGVMNLDDLIEKLVKFAKDGSVTDINSAKKIILAIQTIIEKHPEQLVIDDLTTSENIAKLEKLRKAVGDALQRIEQLGGSGCRMTYVFYKAK